MESTSIFFLNYLSIGALLVVVICIFSAAFILSLKNKSKLTIILGFLLLFMFLFNLPYVFAQVIYHPAAAYHRWGTVLFVLATETTFTQFSLYYPENIWPRLSRYLLAFQSFLTIAVSAYFIQATATAKKIFHSSGHYWDFDAEAASRIVAATILLFALIYLVVSIAKIRRLKGTKKWALIIISIGILLSAVVPGITNGMSRSGLLEREIHQTIAVIAFLTTIFTILIVYINNTTDRTSFMAKIIGTSLVSFSMMFQFISFFTLRTNEQDYNAIKLQELHRVVEGNYEPKDLLYSASFSGYKILKSEKDEEEKKISTDDDNDNSNFNITFPKQDFKLPLDKIKIEMQTTVFLESLLKIPNNSPNFMEQISVLNNRVQNKFFRGYSELIKSKLPVLHGKKELLLNSISSIQSELKHQKFKIHALKDNNFKIVLKTYLNKKFPKKLIAFKKAMLHFLKNTTLKNMELKKKVQLFLSPMHNSTYRHYREAKNKTHFISFIIQNKHTGIIWEAGFSYIAYRSVIHERAKLLVIIFLVVIAFILIGFPLFFRGSLVTPLNNLLAGVRKVNEGDLNVEVAISVEDEIGFISASFNGMVSSIKEARKRLQEYADQLESKVQERTKEVVAKMDEIHQMKIQQDGDYYLTALIHKPLATNQNRSKKVITRMYMEQKKKFSFRDRSSELGGDICITGNLLFGQRRERYIMFANGDAMGKSMQGAGGAIVLGTALNNIMSRSAAGGRTLKSVSPAMWLSDTFNELDNIFKTFDGSMMCSIVMGLINENNGKMYYFNAEHPWSILYRNGESKFIEKELLLRKLGSFSEFEFSIQEFRLRPGDTLICGSDGRDDIQIGKTNEGSRIINEDENIFLEITKKSKGNIKDIVENLHNTGSITDDLSLLQIEFQHDLKEDESTKIAYMDVRKLYRKAKNQLEKNKIHDAIFSLKKALDKDSEHLESLHLLGLIEYRQGNYKNAINLFNKFLKIDIDNPDMWFYLSVCFKHLKNFDKSMAAAEQVQKFQPRRISNLINLADCHRMLGHKLAAKKVIRQVLAMEPNKNSAIELLNLLK